MKKNFKLLLLTLIMGGGFFASEAMALDQVDGVYQIGTAQDLIDFAGIVNGGAGASNAVLNADIDMTGQTWTPIGQDQNDYKGHFDGQGHRIKNLVIDNSSYGNQALFGQAVGGAIIENIIIDSSCSIKGKCWVAGILGHVWGDGVIVRNCGNEASITAVKNNNEGGQNAAGIVGCSEKIVHISNCYNTGTISGDRECAGICAWMGNSESTMTYCFSSGSVTIGEGLYRYNNGWNGASNNYQIGGSQGTSFTDEEKNNGTLCANMFGSGNHIFATNWGFCPVCDGFVTNWMTPVNGYYEIGNSNQLNWFACFVDRNSDNTSANAKLTADIDFSQQGVMIGYADEDGKRYKGHFDGQGHTVTVGYDRSEKFAALFGMLGSGAIVENLRTAGTITTSNQHAAGIAGGSRGNAQIRNCVSAVAITGTGSGDGTHAGICGFMHDDGSITNCAFVGSLTTTDCTGNAGILGFANGGDRNVLTNCYVYADFSFKKSEANSWAMKRNTSSLDNCYYIKKTENGHFQISNNNSQLANNDNFEDASIIESGNLCFNLNKNTDVWHQTLGTDTYPVPFSTDHGAVSLAGNIYNNSGKTGDYFGVKNKDDMEALATYVNAGNNNNVTIKLENDIDMSGSSFLGIGTADKKFSGQIDGQGHRILKWVVNDNTIDRVGLIRYALGITLKNMTMDNTCSFTVGNYSAPFVADMNHSTTQSSFINLGNEASVTGGTNAGGIIGCNFGGFGNNMSEQDTWNRVTMINCYNTGSISGKESGALAGWFGDAPIIFNCYSTGTVSGDGSNGFGRGNATNPEITGYKCINCFTTSESGMDGVTTSVQSTDFENGTVFASLFAYTNPDNNIDGSVWRMYFDTDDATKSHPVLYGKAIAMREDCQNRMVAGTYDVTVYRTIKDGVWNTMCLPFALSTSDEAFKNAFGSEAKVAELNTSTSNTDMLHFTTVDNMTAGKAYLVKPTKNNTNFVVSTTVSDDAPSSTEAGGLNFIGVYSPKELTSNDLVMTTNKNTNKNNGGNTIKGVNDGTILNGFRAYLTPSGTGASGNGARATSFTIDEDGTTGIITATGDVIENGKMYNLGGQRVNEPQRGLYIVNGKKYIK